ncbi:GNAT family N-acetyltransferase [Paenibacillus tarimensis]|uniref:GNAT family N-acetyltransferase n=1 Tax=Paenibacillus tarimensis TaxID=416012 RepID=UPI001F3DC1B6|nr:GNAT family N-acetyltransferase [Paenibacillus tarimensis]MCF2945562.1 GNAT family N-acetyltransferase [Paenibacillus tarimensis]
MINQINNQDEQTAAELLALQIDSYQVEAQIIGYADLPPLHETKRDIMESSETYLGFLQDGRIAGAVAFEAERDALILCKMMVHPQFFNMGIASKLLRAVMEQGIQVNEIRVSTGARNEPAIRLYRKHGFVETGMTVINEQLSIKHLIKPINN